MRSFCALPLRCFFHLALPQGAYFQSTKLRLVRIQFQTDYNDIIGLGRVFRSVRLNFGPLYSNDMLGNTGGGDGRKSFS